MSDTALDWLPERHLGVAATLSHADELIGQISDLLFVYQTQADGVIGLTEVPADRISQTVVDRVALIPRKMPLLVADALVALRAALEHVLFAEVEFLDGSQLDEKAARLVEMPASETYDNFSGWVGRRAKNGPPSLRAGSELVKRIEGLQPFHLRTAPEAHPLARLVLHTNHLKHRTPAITAVRIAAMYEDDRRPHSMRDLPLRPEEPVRVGDVIAETPIGTQIPVTLFPTIGINRPGTDRWPVLMTELDELTQWVRTQGIPRLVTGGEPPGRALPTRFATAVGHEDERGAIAAGATVSAVERHRQRLGAASVRADLADTISQLEDSPSAEQIVAWLAHLSDGEVLSRMSRLRITETYEPDAVLRNFRVLEDLRNEASSFGDIQPPEEQTRVTGIEPA